MRSPRAPTEPSDGISGRMPSARNSISLSATSRRIPLMPCAREHSLTTKTADVSSSSSFRPKPQPCILSTLRDSSAAYFFGTWVPTEPPTLVVTP